MRLLRQNQLNVFSKMSLVGYRPYRINGTFPMQKTYTYGSSKTIITY